MAKTKKIKFKSKLPSIIKGMKNQEVIEGFPLAHYSYSSMVQFSINPIMFKIKYINGDKIDTANSISSVIGRAFHAAMDVFYTDDTENRVANGLQYGMDFLHEYNPNFIEFNQSVQNIQKAQDVFVFAYNSYLNEEKSLGETIIATEEKLEEQIDVEWRGQQLALPVPLKGYIDKVVRDDQGRLKIKDYKTTRAFSNPDKIDGTKIIQSVMYYLLAYSAYGEKPYSMVFEEVKTTSNRNGEPQVKRYEIVFEENEQFFDFFFRFYEDMTKALNGEAVFVPNILSFFDNETAIVAYIHRLDVTEDKAREMKKLRVDNITDLLKKKIQKAGNMKKFLQNLEKTMEVANQINYKDMSKEQQIQTKLLEHGMVLHFVDRIEGLNIDLYRYEPSIGLKMKRIEGYVADIEQVVGTSGVRVLAPIPNTTYVGFEVPRKDRKFIEEKPVNKGFELAIGKDVMGDVFYFDVRQAPHMLVAGATGSGKSVFLNTVIAQLNKIKGAELHLFDPKLVELSMFRNEKNVAEYQSDPEAIYNSLKNLVDVMNDRYERLAAAKVRSIVDIDNMSYKFVVIDEFGDLIIGDYTITKREKVGDKFVNKELNISKEISRFILLLAQKARACGIHIIIATQRPSVNIITGSIKANFPTKVAFRCSKAIDSQVVLDQAGAEKLLGKGDMIFSSESGDVRLQGYNY